MAVFRMTARGLPGGARRGLDAWLAQRATAVWLTLYCALFGARLAWRWTPGGLGHAAWRALFQPGWMKMATLLAAAALLLHAWLGLQEIMRDYVRLLPARLALLFVFAVLYLASLAQVADALWRLEG